MINPTRKRDKQTKHRNEYDTWKYSLQHKQNISFA